MPHARPHFATLLVIFMLLAGGLLAAVAQAPNPQTRPAAVVPAQLTGTDAGMVTTPAAPAIEEDAPGWDCAVHGNRICGTPAP